MADLSINRELQNLIDAFSEYHEGEDESIGSLLITADEGTDRGTSIIRGNLKALATGFGNTVGAAGESRTLMLSLIVSYFVVHDDDLKMLLEGIAYLKSQGQ